MNYRRAIKRVIPLDVLQGDELKEVLARYAAPEDEFGHEEGEGDGGGSDSGTEEEDSASSVSSAAFSGTDPQRPPVSLSPTRLVNMNARDLRPAVSAHCHKKGTAKASRSCHDNNNGRSDDGSAAALALAAATTAAAATAGGGAWPTWVPAAIVPYLTAKWVAIAAIALALLYAGIRYYKLWRALGWQYALSAAFPFLRALLCGVSGLDSQQVEAEIEAFQGGYHPIQGPPPPPGYHPGQLGQPPPPPPPGAKPAAAAAQQSEETEGAPKEEPEKEEPKAEPDKKDKKSVTFSRDRVVALMVDRALAAK